MSYKLRVYDAVRLQQVKVADNKRKVFETKDSAGSDYALRIRIAASHAGIVTRNNGFYLPDKMVRGARSMTKNYGKPFLVHHNERGEPVGRIVDARYVDISKEAKTLTDSFVSAFNRPSKIQDKLDDIDELYFKIRDDEDYGGLGYIEQLVDISDPDAIKKVLDGRYLTVSIGATTDSAVCSICRHDWAEEGPCDHTPGEIYDITDYRNYTDARRVPKEKKMQCFLVSGDLHYDETSFVNTPADPHAGVIEILGPNSQVVQRVDSVQVNRSHMVLVDMYAKKSGYLSDMSDARDVNICDAVGHGKFLLQEREERADIDYETPVAKAKDGGTDKAPTGSKEESEKVMTDDKKAPADVQDSTQAAAGATATDNKDSAAVSPEPTVTKIDVEKLRQEISDRFFATRQKDSKLPVEEVKKAVKEGLTFGDGLTEADADKAIEDLYTEDSKVDIRDLLAMSEDAKYEEMCKILDELGFSDAKLSTEKRKKLKGSTFCGPDRSFPVPDCAHVTAARRLIGRYKGSGSKERILACVSRKASALGCGGKKDSVSDEGTTTQVLDEKALTTASNEQVVEAYNKIVNIVEEKKISIDRIHDKLTREVEILDHQLQELDSALPTLEEEVDALKGQLRDFCIAQIKSLTAATIADGKLTDQKVTELKLEDKSLEDLKTILTDLTEKVVKTSRETKISDSSVDNPAPNGKMSDGVNTKDSPGAKPAIRSTYKPGSQQAKNLRSLISLVDRS